jgi:hypothetical protein
MLRAVCVCVFLIMFALTDSVPDLTEITVFYDDKFPF